jgi:hypothetical protein
MMAIFLIASAKKSVSSHQVARQLNISIKRAWHLTHRIREAMANDPMQAELFRGIVQADEYYLGGVPRPEERAAYGPWQTPDKKVPILGMYEKESGMVRTRALRNTKSAAITKAGEKWLDLPAVELHTDESVIYNAVGRKCEQHRTVNHSKQYVTCDGVHTNHIENAWSLFARAIMGSFHHVSRKHLHRYLSEFDGRFNSREKTCGDYVEEIIQQGFGRKLTFNRMVGKLPPIK